MGKDDQLDHKLIDYRLEQIEKAQEKHEEDDKLVHGALKDQITSMKVEIIKVATKVAIYGTIVGAVGASIFQSFLKTGK